MILQFTDSAAQTILTSRYFNQKNKLDFKRTFLHSLIFLLKSPNRHRYSDKRWLRLSIYHLTAEGPYDHLYAYCSSLPFQNYKLGHQKQGRGQNKWTIQISMLVQRIHVCKLLVSIIGVNTIVNKFCPIFKPSNAVFIGVDPSDDDRTSVSGFDRKHKLSSLLTVVQLHLLWFYYNSFMCHGWCRCRCGNSARKSWWQGHAASSWIPHFLSDPRSKMHYSSTLLLHMLLYQQCCPKGFHSLSFPISEYQITLIYLVCLAYGFPPGENH